MENYSVLMTVYKKDNPKYLIKSIESMLNQTMLTNDFVLVFDGEVTNKLESAIQNVFKDREQLLHIIRLPQNVGLGMALRKGIQDCKNELVARMDDDDISHPKRCEIQFKYMKEHPDISILGAYVNEFEDYPEHTIRQKKVPIGSKEIYKYSKRRNPFNHSTVMLRKTDLISAGNYSEMRTNQDVETWVRMLNTGYKGANIPLSLVDFRFDKKTYERRKDINNIRLMIKLWNDFWKKGYCSILDYSYVFLLQITIFILPPVCLKWLYNKFR